MYGYIGGDIPLCWLIAQLAHYHEVPDLMPSALYLFVKNMPFENDFCVGPFKKMQTKMK